MPCPMSGHMGTTGAHFARRLHVRQCKLAHQCSGQRRPLSVRCAAAAASAKKTYYDTLGVLDTASVRDIKDAFRRLALMWHPDRCKQPGAQSKFMELKTAYDTLVDLTARAKYDLQLKQAMAPPPISQTAGPGPVGYDWSKYRTTSVRRTASVRKPSQQQQATGFATPGMPPRPHARGTSGDDYEGHSGAFRSPSVSSFHNDAAARSASTASTSGYGTSGYRSIFDSDTSQHGFTRVSAGSQARAQTPPAYGRSSSARSGSVRSSSSSRYGRSATPQRSGSRSAWSARAASPTAAQQWHSMYCHSGDDFIASSGTSYAATTALVRVGSSSAAPSSSWGGESWHHNVSGDGFVTTALATTNSTAPALPQQVDHATAWRSAAATVGGGDDYVQNQHALVKVEQKSSLPVKVTPAWNTVGSFISVRMS